MCPLWPVHFILMYMLMFGMVWLASFKMVGAAMKVADQYNITFGENSLDKLLMDETISVDVHFTRVGDDASIVAQGIMYSSEDEDVVSVNPKWEKISSPEEDSFSSTVNVTGEFIGRREICAKLVDEKNETISTQCADVIVTRESGAIDKAFTYSVIVLVAIIYVNMGAALDTEIVKQTMKRPIGPAIGFMAQFVIMPLLAYGIAKALIPDESLQLGLFITGCSPAGGASNIWTLTLGGNLDLSITMTTISTFSAFVMMPLWILYFGRLITTEAHLRIPNSRIATFCVSLVVPLFIGIVVKRKLPKVANFLVRILKPFAAFLILFIIVFAIYTNVYIFKLFNWQIVVAGMLLPWLGYILGACSALLCRQNWKDSLAIGIETGVQNTGLAIFVLRFSLDPPDSDLTTVMPVAVAIMTPVLPMVLFVVQKIVAKVRPSEKGKEAEVRACALLIGTEEGSINSQCNLIGDGAFQPASVYPS